MTDYRALIIDDEPDILELLEITLARMEIHTTTASNVAEAKAALGQQTFDLCLTDMRLPDGNGIELVEYLQQQAPETPVAVITAHGNMDTAVAALKAGAFDFVSKPVALDQLRNLVKTALKLAHTRTPDHLDEPSGLVGASPVMTSLRQQIRKLARSQAPVYISGESGSGKELVARAIHHQGARASGPFIAVNCGAIPGELMESEFFGHKKGSFTGAHQDKQGLFQAASGGTLFLDEVADLPLAMQVKLLRAIQEKAIRPVGSQQEVATDIRILSATHKNLAQEVEAGRFRSDLFYRINVIELKVPPLRERRSDIPLLAQMFLQRFAQEVDVPIPQLSAEAANALDHYPFPGNVRELENILERAFTLCEDNHIDENHLQLPDSTPAPLLPEVDTEQPVTDLEGFLADIERDILQRTLEQTRWNKTEAAKALGLTFRQLRYKLKKLGID